MVEGPGVHRVAIAHRKLLLNKVFSASSPNGRFTEGAAAIDGTQLVRIEAHGKNLFYFFRRIRDAIAASSPPPPPPQPAPTDPSLVSSLPPISTLSPSILSPFPSVEAPNTRRRTTRRKSSPLLQDVAAENGGEGRKDEKKEGQEAGREEEGHDADEAKDDVVVHIHFGMSGQFSTHKPPGPDPRSTTRLLLSAPSLVAHLSAMTCQHGPLSFYHTMRAKLGEDPLRHDADKERVWEMMQASKRSVGAFLMDQSKIAGIGNIYRTEILFTTRLHPDTPSNQISPAEFSRIWDHTSHLLQVGVEVGRIVTTADAIQALGSGAKISGRTRRDWRYVYNRKSCGVCKGPIRSWTIAARTVYACESCQRPLIQPGDVSVTAPAEVPLQAGGKEAAAEVPGVAGLKEKKAATRRSSRRRRREEAEESSAGVPDTATVVVPSTLGVTVSQGQEQGLIAAGNGSVKAKHGCQNGEEATGVMTAEGLESSEAAAVKPTRARRPRRKLNLLDDVKVSKEDMMKNRDSAEVVEHEALKHIDTGGLVDLTQLLSDEPSH